LRAKSDHSGRGATLAFLTSKLRACDLVKLRLDDIGSNTGVRHRAAIFQKKTRRRSVWDHGAVAALRWSLSKSRRLPQAAD